MMCIARQAARLISRALPGALPGARLLALACVLGGALLLGPPARGQSTQAQSTQAQPTQAQPTQAQPTQAQPGAIEGAVTDAETEAPLPGVNVVIEGTRQGASTDAEGRYTISGVEAGTYDLQASFVGYATEAVAGVEVQDGERTTVNVALQPSTVALDEVVAVGYGTQQRKDLTGAVASIEIDQVKTTPVASVDQLLQGQAAGVQVTQSSGAPGGAVSVRIRGTSSITASAEPLYVIDGVPAFVSGGNDVHTNPLAGLSPTDIESIEILKDASATAIYGARGANGVVLVTTKRGRRGENTVRFESNFGMQEITRTIPMLSAQQFAELHNEARVNAGLEPAYSADEIAQMGIGTDWQEEIFRSAPVQNHTLSVSGGDEKTRYLVSGAFFDQRGIIINSGLRRYSGRLNLNRDVSERFRVGNSLALSRSTHDIADTDGRGGSGIVEGALEFAPMAPVRNENGEYVLVSPLGRAVNNPVATARALIDERAVSRLLGNVFAEYDIADGLRFRTSLGGHAAYVRNTYYAPRTISQGITSQGEARVGSAESRELVNDNILTYKRSILEGHYLEFTGGFTAQTSRSELVETATQGFATDITGPNNLSAGSQPLIPSSNVDEWTLLSWLGRANYHLLDKYLFTVTARYDGSSKFGAKNKWGFFPSTAFAWRLSDEPFLRDAEAISDLKLRTSFGLTGNQEIGTYASLSQLQPNLYLVGNNPVITYAPASQASNPDLKWESTRQFDLGVDLGLLDDRVTLTADYYNSYTDDLLLRVTLPTFSGFQSQLQNVGAVRNRGVELGVNTINVESETFAWRTSLNISRNSNEVADIGNAEQIFGASFGSAFPGAMSVVEVGKPLGTFIGYRTNGIWQQGEDFSDSGDPNAAPGEWKYVDVNNDGIINADDRTDLGNGYPEFFGGLRNSFTFGPVTLDVFLQGAFGNEILNYAAVWQSSVVTASNERASSFERWTPEHPSNTVPRANLNRERRLLDVHIENGSYLRLQNVTLGYRLPERIVPSAARARIYVSGQNLWTWTEYTGYDPEVNSRGGDSINRGLDFGTFPKARTLSAGVNLTF